MLKVGNHRINSYKYLTADMYLAEFKYSLTFENDHCVLTDCYSSGT